MKMYNSWKPQVFFNTPDDGDGGGSAGAPSAVDLLDDGGNANAGDGGGGDGGDGAAPPSKPFVDADELAAKFAQHLGQHFKPPQIDEPKQKLSPEEARKLLNVWEPDDKWYQDFDNLDTRKAAVGAMRDGMFKQFDTIMQARIKEAVEQLGGRLAPIETHYNRAESEAMRGRFSKSYPELAGEELFPIIQAVGQQLQASGARFKTEKEMFDAVATGVAATVQKFNPGFKLGGTPKTKPGSGRSMSTTSSGGGGGGGGGGGSSDVSGKPRAVTLLG